MPLYDADPTTAQILAPVLMQFFQAKQAAEQREQERRMQEEQMKVQAEERKQKAATYEETVKRQKLLDMAKERYLGAPEMTQPESLMMPMGMGGSMMSMPTIPPMQNPERGRSLQRLQTLDPQNAFVYGQIGNPEGVKTSGMATAEIGAKSREGIAENKRLDLEKYRTEKLADADEQLKISRGRLAEMQKRTQIMATMPLSKQERQGFLGALDDEYTKNMALSQALEGNVTELLRSGMYKSESPEVLQLRARQKEAADAAATVKQLRESTGTTPVTPGGGAAKPDASAMLRTVMAEKDAKGARKYPTPEAAAAEVRKRMTAGAK